MSMCLCVFELNKSHLSSGDIHEHGEAGHVIALTADVGAVSENHLAAFSRPAAVPATDTKGKNCENKDFNLPSVQVCVYVALLTGWCGSRKHRWVWSAPQW